jgi:hypothetical protein
MKSHKILIPLTLALVIYGTSGCASLTPKTDMVTPTVVTTFTPTLTSTIIPTMTSTPTATPLPPTSTPQSELFYLSELVPYSAYSPAPYVVGKFPFSDPYFNIAEGDLLAWNGYEYPHGMLVGPTTVLTYELSGRYFHFTSQVTKFYSNGCGDGVDFRVLADMQEIARIHIDPNSSDVKMIDVDITGARLLTLITDPINNFDCDESIWGEPLLYAFADLTDMKTPEVIEITTLPESEPLPPKMVWAIYYGWYQPMVPWMWWENNDRWIDYPIGRYNVDDPDVVRSQMRQAKSAGIDGFSVEWLGMQGADLDSHLRLMLQIAEEEDFKIIANFDLLFLEVPTRSDVLANTEYLLRNYGSQPAYFRINGKPVIMYTYNFRVGPPSLWRGIFNELEQRGLSGFFIGDQYSLEYLDVFDGIYDYAPSLVMDVAKFYPQFNQQFINYCTQNPEKQKIWLADAIPGFNNTPVHKGLHGPTMELTIVDRQDGEYFRKNLQAAIDSGAPWIIITTWNEYLENTEIEPSELYGNTYLDITRQLVLPWKDK